MIHITIEEQKKWLRKNLIVELLTSNESNRNEIMCFETSDKGDNLGAYLKEKAWEEDDDGCTKVYLVKDKTNGNIAFFFELKAGLLYKTFDDIDIELTPAERDI